MKEHYIKIFIKDESDLPKEDGEYFGYLNNDYSESDRMQILSFEKRLKFNWHNVLWYLKLEEPAKGLTDDRTSKLEELVGGYKNLLNCFGLSKPKNNTHIDDLDEAWDRISELRKELNLK